MWLLCQYKYHCPPIPNQLKTEKSENNLRHCGDNWLTTLKSLFPGGDDEGAFIVPALDARSQIFSIKDRRNGIGKPVFKLAPLGCGQTITFVAPDLCVLCIFPEVLQRVLSQANRPHVLTAAPSPPRFFAALRFEALFCVFFPFRWALCAI